MTLIPTVYKEADSFFPQLDISNEWEIIQKDFTVLDKCTFLTLKRR